MAAIGLAAAVIAARHGRETIVGSFAADHVIADEAAFVGAVRQAAALAGAGWVATIGIEASGPSTAFGYIHCGGPAGVPGAPDGRRVLAFTEKPDAATAAAYLAAGDYRWNVIQTSIYLGFFAFVMTVAREIIKEVADRKTSCRERV